MSSFISETGIVLDFELDQQVWLEAGRRFARYAKLRRRSAPEGPKRLLADFLTSSPLLKPGDPYRDALVCAHSLRWVPASQSGFTTPHLHRLYIGLIHP